MTDAVYLRISDDKLGLELGTDRQREDTHRVAAPDATEYVDNDISATKGRHRPGYAALMAAVARGEVTRIVVWHPSRLWRNRRERADGIEALREARVSLVCVKGPTLDMTSAYARGMAGLVGEFDTMESEIKAERVARELVQRAQRGLYHGGPRPYGYTPDGMSLVEGEAAVVAGWYRDVLAGRSVAGLARSSGRSYSTVRSVLLNPRYAGLRILHGVEYPGGWPAVVTVEVWRAVSGMFDDQTRRTNGGRTARRWLGSGLYRCARCDRPVGIHWRDAHRVVYRCAARTGGCGRTWRAPQLDAYVEALVTERLGRDDLADLLPANRPDLRPLRTEAAAVRTNMRRIARDAVRLGFDDDQVREANEEGRARLVEIERALAESSSAGALGPLLAHHDPVQAWRDIPAGQVDRRQAIVRALMSVSLGAPPRGRPPAGWKESVLWLGQACVRVGPPAAT